MENDKKILVVSGCLRKNGNTERLLRDFLRDEDPEKVKTVYLRDLDFSGCLACDGCLKKPVCVLKDDLREVYPALETCQSLILASPIYFNGVSWLMKEFIDRLQAYFHHNMDWPRRDKALALFTGGAKGYKDQFTGGRLETEIAFRSLGFEKNYWIQVPNTDQDPYESGSLDLRGRGEKKIWTRKEGGLWE